jgi:hypothetical protein
VTFLILISLKFGVNNRVTIQKCVYNFSIKILSLAHSIILTTLQKLVSCTELYLFYSVIII